MNWERAILHVDMNHYYAAVEEMRNPALRHVPMAVGGSADDRHGIILTKNDLAKKFGVKTGEAVWQAHQKCPGLVLVPPHYDLYVHYSHAAHAIYRRFTEYLEPFGMDEVWLDVSSSQSLFGSAPEMAETIRHTIREELGLTVSIGVSFNKVFAKIGSDMKKPDATTILSPENWRSILYPRPVSELIFVGYATTRKLMHHGILTIGDLAHCDPALLVQWFGVIGTQLSRMARGEDDARVMPDGFHARVKSVGHGITCSCDLTEGSSVFKVILELSQDVGRRLRLFHLVATGIEISVRKSSLGGDTRQTRLPYPTQSNMEIAQAAWQLFTATYNWSEPVRALTVRAISLKPDDLPTQMSFFWDAQRQEKQLSLEVTIDALRERYGQNIVRSACLLGDLHMPDDGREEVVMPGLMYR